MTLKKHLPLTLSPSDLARLWSDPRYSVSKAALLDHMVAKGEVTLETPPPSGQTRAGEVPA